MPQLRVVIPDDFPPVFMTSLHPELERLRGAGAEVVLYSTRWGDRAEFFNRIARAQAVINVRAYSRFDAEALACSPELQLISVLGTGVDNVDVGEASRRGVLVCNTPAVASQAVAELGLGLLLAVARHIAAGDREVRAGTWRHHPSSELGGKVLGLIGLGSIGQHMAALGSGVGMKVIAWNRTPKRDAGVAQPIEMVEFDEVFRRADVVSVHLRGSAETAGIVGAREIGLMKAGAIMINTARAAVVDYAALAEAIRAGRLAGAGLDVHPTEPLQPEQNLFADLDNVVLTPHSGAVTEEANARSIRESVENVVRFLAGTPHHVVKP